MKKKFIIAIVIIVIFLIGIGTYFMYQKIQEEGRKYEIEEIRNPQYFLLKQQEAYGVINRNGDTIIEPVYDNVVIPNPEKGIFVCYEDNNTKILNENKEEQFINYSKVQPIRLKNIASSFMYEKSVLTYQKEGKMGLINLEGKEIGKCDYDQIEALPYKEGELLVKQGEKYGILNIKGNSIIEIEYNQITVDNYYTEENGYQYAGYLVSQKTEEGYRYGYIDRSGREILKPEFNELSRITDIKDDDIPYFITARNGQYGVTKKDETIINNEYQSIRYNNSSNLLVIERSKKYGVATLEGKIIIPIEYNQIDVTGMYLYARKGTTTEVYDYEGNLTKRDSNIAILPTENEKYYIQIDNTEGTIYRIVDKNEKVLTQKEYSYIEYLEGEYFIASLENGKLGVIDANGNEKLEIKYDSIEKIQGYELIKMTIAQNQITYLYTFDLTEVGNMEQATVEVKEAYIKMYNDAQTKYFDKKGNEIENTQVLTEQKIFAKEIDGKWGFVDYNDNVVIENIYDKVTDFNEYGYAGIKKDNKWGIVNQAGTIILEPKYEFTSSIEPSFIGEYYQVSFGFGEIYYTD